LFNHKHKLLSKPEANLSRSLSADRKKESSFDDSKKVAKVLGSLIQHVKESGFKEGFEDVKSKSRDLQRSKSVPNIKI